MSKSLQKLSDEIQACRHCVEPERNRPLPHEPRPVFIVSPKAKLCIAGQAPGTRVHASGVPFTDPSGVRLREWLGINEKEFYDAGRVAIVPMGFCFPGLDAKGSDLPPRRECAQLWRTRLFAELPRIKLLVLVGLYAQRWHLGKAVGANMTDTVRHWQEYLAVKDGPRMLPLPHPSWRNNSWLKKNTWFATELLPRLQADVRALLDAQL